MINLSSISISFGAHYLFDNLNIAFKKKDKVGLIGRNGAGKSTLLKIISGVQAPTEGNITTPNDYTIGYLPQEIKSNSDKTIFDETFDSLKEVKSIKTQIDNLTQNISERTDYNSKNYMDSVQKLTELNDRFELLGGNSIDAEIEKVLIGLGFNREDFIQPLQKFSGGWQMRVEIAKILLNKPDCILLDEPTNHLDIESIWWLENFLKNYYGLVILVSHDIRFLDNITNRTIEISKSRVYDYDLPYSQFIVQREQIRQQQQNAYENQQKQIAQTQRFIDRFRYKASLASRVQSKEKMLEKMDKIEVDDIDNSTIKFSFPKAPRSGKVVAETKILSKSFDNNDVLKNINFDIERNEKIAFVGKNGEGKTTFSRILAGDITEFNGMLKIGTNIKIGYYAQHQAEKLNPDSTIFDIIDQAATGDIRTQIRTLLGAFLFSGDDVYKKVKVLSGGEKSRLAIATLLLQATNFLIMDEPTNHLDMKAKEVLKNALLEYSGTLIIVSHDRDFLHTLTNRTIYFKNKNITEYIGDIYEFIEKFQLDSLKQLEKENDVKKENPNIKSKNQIEREKRKSIQREKNKIKKEIEEIEHKIELLESKINEYDELFSTQEYYNNTEQYLKTQEEYHKLKNELNQNYDLWEILSSKFDEI